MTWKIKFIPFPNQNPFVLNLVKSEATISRRPTHLAISPCVWSHSESPSKPGSPQDESVSPACLHGHYFLFRGRKKRTSTDKSYPSKKITSLTQCLNPHCFRHFSGQRPFLEYLMKLNRHCIVYLSGEEPSFWTEFHLWYGWGSLSSTNLPEG